MRVPRAKWGRLLSTVAASRCRRCSRWTGSAPPALVELIVRPQAREIVRARATVVRTLRDSPHGRQFLEVEIPMPRLVYGGAAALS
jgi:hypothetical protein